METLKDLGKVTDSKEFGNISGILFDYMYSTTDKNIQHRKKHLKQSQISKRNFQSSLHEVKDMNLLQKMRLLAKIADLGYCRYPRDLKIEANVVHIGGFITVYFAGQKFSRSEWQQRKSLSPRSHKGLIPKGWVDSEWSREVDLKMPFLLGKISRIMQKNIKPLKVQNKIYFVGHGIGGVYATLAALLFSIEPKYRVYFESWSPKLFDVEVFTYGQPRFATKPMQDLIDLWLNGRIYRITHTNDFVPRLFLPPGQYHHLSKEYWITLANCDCASNRNMKPQYKVYQCSITNFEDPECNVGTSENQSNIAMQTIRGPYFGINFGQCKYAEIMFPKLLWDRFYQDQIVQEQLEKLLFNLLSEELP
ncbi:hypothetical protein G9A89_010195 [Geosiphon pyriformis]|nr:hypothetical protein G9A89_010195 [Geosiphon pyriformis]